MGDYPQALDYYQQSLVITRDIGDRAGEGTTLGNIGIVYRLLGDYPQALDYYQQSLVITRDIGDRAGEGTTLGNIGIVYENLGDYPQALDYHQQALVILRDINDRAGEASTLENIGVVYQNLGDYPQALDYYQQSLAIERILGRRGGEAISLGNIGLVYQLLGDYPQALGYYQQSLTIKRDIGDRAGEGKTLGNLGRLLEAQAQPELAIVFFKQAVNIYETMRDRHRGLEQDLQASYTDTIEGAYRELADLLLQQDRVLEAQRVLDLLKVQELDDYLRGVRRNANTETGVGIREAEAEILRLYKASENELIRLGRERARLAKIPVAERTAEQQARIIELRRLENLAFETFRVFLRSEAVAAQVERLRRNTEAANLETRELNALRDNLQNLQELGQAAVVLYPLVLEDRLELILVTAAAPPVRRTATVDRVELNRVIGNLRYALESPTRDAETPAKQLYQWLIQPIVNDLAQANVDTIIYAPDQQLRYIPLTALHDGEAWLAQSYRVNNITAASLDDLDNLPTPGPFSVLAAAFTEGEHQVQVGNRQWPFRGLTYAGQEVENLGELIPQTVKRLNQAFGLDILFEMDDYQIVHLATHAAFNPGPPENSFIVFGNGEHANLVDIEGWSFPNVELIVLSACETAVGDVPLGDGKEILGFGYRMQEAGADAAIASLWSVDDGGAQLLMDAFYEALSRGGLSKAAALQQAQIALIRAGKVQNRGGFEALLAESGLDIDPEDLSHPYYWAPFILIGNGL